MNFLYFGTKDFLGVPCSVDRVHVADTPIEMIYTTNIETTNTFLIKTYDYNAFIFHVWLPKHLERIKEMRQKCGSVCTHVIVSQMEDRAEVLFNLQTDTDLGITVYFLLDEKKLETLILTILKLNPNINSEFY